MEPKLYRYRWVVVGIFWFVIFAYGANWFALSPLLSIFESPQWFNIPAWESHLLISLIGMFVIFFAWPAGSLIDKKGPKLAISIGSLFMAIGFGCRPWLLGSFSLLLLSSIIAGIGLAWILVALAPQMLRWFPEKNAGLPVGIAASGLFIGFGTGSLVMPLLTNPFDKTHIFNGFLIFGIIAIIAFIIWLIFSKDHPRTPPEERNKVEKMRFVEGMKHIFSSKNAFIYPLIGFFIVGITLVISSFIHHLYQNEAAHGGYIAGSLLYGCALGAFFAPYIAKKYGLKKITLLTVGGSVFFWIILFGIYQYTNVTWMLLIFIAFVFGACLQASWPLALYSQEIEKGVSEANVGIAASLYVSISNIGAAILPVIFPILFPFNHALVPMIAILACLIICFCLWTIIKKT